ncbi:MAG: FAD-binding oxidoreductase [Alphaproteobacteria bacterium]|nr:FAD-binding oxidoreductase [Alphaproteobacteria bacterium]
MIETDVIVIGAGIAGASVAAQLSATKSVTILDMEGRAGYHTTGRSAAIFSENYGTVPIRALTRASRTFFADTPSGFCDHPLLSPRGIIYLARANQLTTLKDFEQANLGVEHLTQAELYERVPYLNKRNIVAGLLEVGGFDIDVNALHTGYLRQARNNGAELLCNHTVTSLGSRGGNWSIATTRGLFHAPVIINAAGAWADEIAILAGVAPVGLKPLKRTAAIVKFDRPINRDMCFLNDIGENWYCRPEGSNLFLSPEDEIPSPPCDAWADDMDVAAVIEQITEVLDLVPVKVESSWAGLRTFAPDHIFVIGFAPDAAGFFWLAGQGGYGFQTAPASAALAASLVLDTSLPDYLQEQGLDAAQFSPNRFWQGKGNLDET